MYILFDEKGLKNNCDLYTVHCTGLQFGRMSSVSYEFLLSTELMMRGRRAFILVIDMDVRLVPHGFRESNFGVAYRFQESKMEIRTVEKIISHKNYHYCT